MRRRLSESAQLERRRREREPGGGALVEMRIDVVHDGEVLLSVGGVWDRRQAAYDPPMGDTVLGDPGACQTRVAAFPHEGELEAIRWFGAWLRAHVNRRDSPPALDEAALMQLEKRQCDPSVAFSALFVGGRRGGKTWTAALLCALYALAFPGSIIWVVNPTDQKHDECRRYFSRLLSGDWIDRETVADGWELANGSAIMLKSAYVGSDPDAIKEGEAHLVWLNEGQKIAQRVYIVARGAVADKSGLVLICANPPVEAKDQQWVADFAIDAQAGRRMAHHLHFDPRLNPHINRIALLSLKYELDVRSFRIEVLGEILAPADRVAYNWIRTPGGNERPVPGRGDPWIDVTREFLRDQDLGDTYTDIAGNDFQVHPHIGGAVIRIYMPASERRPTRSNVVLWGVDEIVIEGDELEWCALARAKGYKSDRLIIVGDGTGEYQHSRHGQSDAPIEWHGRGSFDLIKQGGFWNITRPDPRIRRNNPHVLDRVRAMTSMIETAAHERRFFLDPEKCPVTAKSMHEWPTINGIPARRHEAAHAGDAVSYVIHRLFPRRLRSDTTSAVDPIIELVDLPPPRPQFAEAPSPGRKRTRGL